MAQFFELIIHTEDAAAFALLDDQPHLVEGRPQTVDLSHVLQLGVGELVNRVSREEHVAFGRVLLVGELPEELDDFAVHLAHSHEGFVVRLFLVDLGYHHGDLLYLGLRLLNAGFFLLILALPHSFDLSREDQFFRLSRELCSDELHDQFLSVGEDVEGVKIADELILRRVGVNRLLREVGDVVLVQVGRAILLGLASLLADGVEQVAVDEQMLHFVVADLSDELLNGGARGPVHRVEVEGDRQQLKGEGVFEELSEDFLLGDEIALDLLAWEHPRVNGGVVGRDCGEMVVVRLIQPPSHHAVLEAGNLPGRRHIPRVKLALDVEGSLHRSEVYFVEVVKIDDLLHCWIK